MNLASLFGVGLPSCLKGILFFACQIKLGCNQAVTFWSAISNLCCSKTEPRKLHTPHHIQTWYPSEMLRGLKQILVQTRRPHKAWGRPVFECLSVWVSPVVVQVSSSLSQGQGLWVQQTWVWHKPSWRRSPLTPPWSHQNLYRTGEIDSWRAQTKPYMHQDLGERSSDPPGDWPRLASECPGISGGGVGPLVACRRVGALSAAVCARDLLKESLFSSLPPP